MTVTVSGRSLHGAVTVPSSKSAVHRLLICAALSDKETVITGTTLSQDIIATVECLQALGADIVIDGDRLLVKPIDAVCKNALLDCGESGSTIRFLLPVAAALGADARFTGRGRLPQRPLSPLYELLCDNGCRLSPQGMFPLSVDGQLCGEHFAANRAVLAFGETGIGTIRFNCCIDYLGVAEGVYYGLGNENFAANITVLAFGKAGCGTGRCYSLINYFVMSEGVNFLLCNEDFAADRTMRAFGKASIFTVRCYGCISYRSVTKGIYSFLCNEDFTADRAVLAFG